MPAIYRAITKSRKTKQWLAMLTVITTGAISISTINIPGIFMEIYSDGEVT